ncbi:MAG: hypothetical protein IJ351_00900, partial [Oscillospiraceae bacterium]|nr:hypothetical protein [Oscillospiraceae bacterium]
MSLASPYGRGAPEGGGEGIGAVKKVPQKAGCAERYSLQNIYRKTAGSVEEPAVWCYNLTAMQNQNTEVYYTPIQMKFPLGFEKNIKIDDPVYTFSEVMAHIDLQKYFVKKGNEMGRPRYDREKLLKIVLF